MITVLSLFKSLGGRWYFKRFIGEQVTMEGIGLFSATNKTLFHYQEQGSVKLSGGKLIAAHRSYAYLQVQNNIIVYHWNQLRARPETLLYSLQLTVPTTGYPIMGKGSCQCIDDTYEAYYIFLTRHQFWSCHTARGPRKNYWIQTLFYRQSPKNRHR